MDTTNFDSFRQTIDALDFSVAPAWQPTLQMRSEQRWASYYAPFDYVNCSARIVLVGITPGITQAINALKAAQSGLRAGLPIPEILRRAKEFASFSGPMRANLTAMLDKVGIARALGIASTTDLFHTRSDLVHFTSALRYPVTHAGENYGGTPRILRDRFTRDELSRWMVDEVRLVPNAFYVPLGASATEALVWLCERDLLDTNRVLTGLPHPSGANAERIAYFLGRKARGNLSVKVDPQKIDSNRSALEGKVALLISPLLVPPPSGR